MRMPLILSAMLAALAIPTGMVIAEDAGSAPAADAAAAPEAAPAAEPGKMADPMEKPMKKKRKKHHRHRHHRGEGGPGHSPDMWDQPYDYVVQDESSCGGSDVDAGKRMPEEVPGQKGPYVPRGE